MQTIPTVLTLFLPSNRCAGIRRVLRGPTSADRMLAAQLSGTNTVAVLPLLAAGFGPRGLACRSADVRPAGNGQGEQSHECRPVPLPSGAGFCPPAATVAEMAAAAPIADE